MDSALRALWGRRLYSRLPLLGGWVRLRAVRKLAADDTPDLPVFLHALDWLRREASKK